MSYKSATINLSQARTGEKNFAMSKFWKLFLVLTELTTIQYKRSCASLPFPFELSSSYLFHIEKRITEFKTIIIS